MPTVYACRNSRSKWWRRASLFALLLVIAVGCAPCQPPEVFQALTSTAPPCWNRICPGTTSSSELHKILEGLSEVDPSEIGSSPVGAPIARTGWRFSRSRAPGYGTGNCVYLDGVVANCTFNYGGPALRLRHIIEKYGDPEYIIPVVGYADARWLQVVLMYPESGFEAGYLVPTWTSDEITLSPNTKIHGYSIFSPDLYGQLLGASIWFSATREEIQEWQRPWPGYGTFVLNVP